jgi:hypothetical protein
MPLESQFYWNTDMLVRWWMGLLRIDPQCIVLPWVIPGLEVLYFIYSFWIPVGWMDCQWWSSTPARGPNVHHDLSLMSQSLILYSSWVHGRNNFLCCMYFVQLVRVLSNCGIGANGLIWYDSAQESRFGLFLVLGVGRIDDALAGWYGNW